MITNEQKRNATSALSEILGISKNTASVYVTKAVKNFHTHLRRVETHGGTYLPVKGRMVFTKEKKVFPLLPHQINEMRITINELKTRLDQLDPV
jgi:transposase